MTKDMAFTERHYLSLRYIHEDCWAGDSFRGQALGKLKGAYEDDFAQLVWSSRGKVVDYQEVHFY